MYHLNDMNNIRMFKPKIAAKFAINGSTQIILEGSNLEKIASYLTDYLKEFYTIK